MLVKIKQLQRGENVKFNDVMRFYEMNIDVYSDSVKAYQHTAFIISNKMYNIPVLKLRSTNNLSIFIR